jgi:SAM-dependent methyltransferase
MNTSIREHNLRAAALWGSGGRAYDRISRSISGAIEYCVDRLNPTIGERIADIATGTGWASRAVAHLDAQVVGVDIAEPLLDAAREIAREQNLTIEYRLGDAEALPFSDEEFDGVISTFGVMFVPDQQRTASELARVCRSGGRLAIAAWLPESNAVRVRQVLQPYAPTPSVPPPSPFVWGMPDWRTATLGRDFSLGFEEGVVITRFSSSAAAGTLTQRVLDRCAQLRRLSMRRRGTSCRPRSCLGSTSSHRARHQHTVSLSGDDRPSGLIRLLPAEFGDGVIAKLR